MSNERTTRLEQAVFNATAGHHALTPNQRMHIAASVRFCMRRMVQDAVAHFTDGCGEADEWLDTAPNDFQYFVSATEVIPHVADAKFRRPEVWFDRFAASGYVRGTIGQPFVANPTAFVRMPRSRVQDLMRDLWRGGVSFVHMAPNEARQLAVIRTFEPIIQHEDYRPKNATRYHFDRGCGKNMAHFMPCTLTGASTEHVAVLIIDGEDEEFRSQKALEEAFFIPAPTDGVPPLIVRTF